MRTASPAGARAGSDRSVGGADRAAVPRPAGEPDVADPGVVPLEDLGGQREDGLLGVVAVTGLDPDVEPSRYWGLDARVPEEDEGTEVARDQPQRPTSRRSVAVEPVGRPGEVPAV